MAAVTDLKKLETAYREIFEKSDKVLKPSHPAKMKVHVHLYGLIDNSHFLYYFPIASRKNCRYLLG